MRAKIFIALLIVFGCSPAELVTTNAPATPVASAPLATSSTNESSAPPTVGSANEPSTPPPTATSGSDEQYIRVLTGKTFEEGKGFPGAVAIGDGTPSMYQKLGAGREQVGLPFWYFFDKGPWTLTVVAEFVADAFRIRGIIVSGTGAPPTAKGVRVGDAVSKVTSVYGIEAPFSGSVGSPLYKDMVMVDVQTGRRSAAPDTEAVFRDSLFYPKLATLFVVQKGQVVKIAAVLP